MRSLLGFLILVTGLALGGDDPDVARLLKQLSSDQFSERKAADRELRKRLPAARVQIAKALETAKDPETKGRLSDMNLSLRVTVLAPSVYQSNAVQELLGAMAVWSKGKAIELDVRTVWRGRFAETVKALEESPDIDYLVVDLRESRAEVKAFDEINPKQIAFVTRNEPVPERTCVTLNELAAMEMVVEACRKDLPKADTWVLFPGTKGKAITEVRTRRFKKVHGGEGPTLQLAPEYEGTWQSMRECLQGLKETHPEMDVIIDAGDNQLSSMIYYTPRGIPVYSMHATPAALLGGTRVKAVFEMRPEDIASSLMPKIVADLESKTHEVEQLQVVPRKLDTENVGKRVLELRQLMLEGRVASERSP